jgi:glycosyltransferase involved in cell wall biosynthesis
MTSRQPLAVFLDDLPADATGALKHRSRKVGLLGSVGYRVMEVRLSRGSLRTSLGNDRRLLGLLRHDFGPDDIVYARASGLLLPALALLSRSSARRFFIEVNGYVVDEGSPYAFHLARRSMAFFRRKGRAVTLLGDHAYKRYAEERLVPRFGGSAAWRSLPLGLQDLPAPPSEEPPQPRVAFVGSLQAWQGVDDLLAVWDDGFAGRGRVLEIRGPDARGSDVERRASRLDDVRVLGPLEPEEVPSYLERSEVLVAPYVAERHERWGLSSLKTVQYAATTRPIVTYARDSILCDLQPLGERALAYTWDGRDRGLLAEALAAALAAGSNGRRATERAELVRVRRGPEAQLEQLASILRV